MEDIPIGFACESLSTIVDTPQVINNPINTNV